MGKAKTWKEEVYYTPGPREGAKVCAGATEEHSQGPHRTGGEQREKGPVGGAFPGVKG